MANARQLSRLSASWAAAGNIAHDILMMQRIFFIDFIV